MKFPEITDDEVNRGNSHMNYWQRQEKMFSKEENRRIKNMVVFVAGAGGLGTHQLLELQRTGVKKIYLLDYDRIVASNLNRQILYGSKDVGKYKTECAKEVLDSFALGTEIIAINERLSANYTIPTDVDIVFDAFDNFAARFILDSLVQEQKIPLIHAGIKAWYGQMTTIISGVTPSLKEIFGEIPEEKEEIQAYSPVVSAVASLQVIEGIKVFLGKDNILTNKLMYIDFSDYSFEIIEL